MPLRSATEISPAPAAWKWRTSSPRVARWVEAGNPSALLKFGLMTTRLPFAVGNPSAVRPRRIPSPRSVVLTRYTGDAAARALRGRIAVANPALISSRRERENIGGLLRDGWRWIPAPFAPRSPGEYPEHAG